MSTSLTHARAMDTLSAQCGANPGAPKSMTTAVARVSTALTPAHTMPHPHAHQPRPQRRSEEARLLALVALLPLRLLVELIGHLPPGEARWSELVAGD